MNKEDFLPIERTPQEEITSFIKRPSKWARFKVNRLAVVGATIILVMIVLAILGPLISPYTYADQSLIDANQSPSFSHWFGTDTLGRDIYTRVMYGARISLTIGFVAAFINLVIGVTYGGIAGYLGGKVDRIMMGLVDVIVRYSTFTVCNFVDGCTWPWLNIYFRSIGHCVLAEYGPYRT